MTRGHPSVRVGERPRDPLASSVSFKTVRHTGQTLQTKSQDTEPKIPWLRSQRTIWGKEWASRAKTYKQTNKQTKHPSSLEGG